MMHSSDESRFRFGPFALDLARGGLQDVEGHSEIKLRPKTFQLLSYFISNPHRLLSKAELTNLLWPDVIVGEDSLTQCVSELRKALRDFDRRIVKTMPRRGYLFAAALNGTELEARMLDTTASEDNVNTILAGLGTRTGDEVADRDLNVKPGGTLLRSRAKLVLPDRPSIAVLPFVNLSSDIEQEYFADGMVEEIITALSRIRWLFVIARNSSFTYKGKAVDVKQVGRELGVRYVLEGSVRKSGNLVRISGQLIDATNAAHIWAENFDGVFDDVFLLQGQVAGAVAAVIEPQIRRSEIERASRKRMSNLDAYDLYLRALGHFHKFKKEDIDEAINLLKRALVIDPEAAAVAALVSICFLTRHVHGGDRVSESERHESIALARDAMRTGTADPEALWMAAITLSYFAAEHALAASAARRALMLNCNSAHAWNAYGFIQLYQNEPEAAIKAFEHAIRLSPLDPFIGYFFSGLAECNMALGRYGDALEWAEESSRRLPDYAPPLRTKIVCCVQLERIEQARRLAKCLLERRPDTTIDLLKKILFRWRDSPPEVVEVQIASLRLAGVPEL